MSKYKQETVAGEQKVIQTFIIRNKKTKEIWTARSGKSSWKKPNHAKNAFAGNDFENKRDPLLKKETPDLGKYGKIYFDDQDVYEIVELIPESKVVVEEVDLKSSVEDLVDVIEDIISWATFDDDNLRANLRDRLNEVYHKL